MDILLEGGADMAVLLDINGNQATFWKDVMSMVRASDSSEECRQKMYSYARNNGVRWSDTHFQQPTSSDPSKWQPIRNVSGLAKALDGNPDHVSGFEWLYEDVKFNKIKDLCGSSEQDCRIRCITADLSNYRAFEEMRDWLKKNHITISTLYTSNIIEFAAGVTAGFFQEQRTDNTLGRNARVVRALAALRGAETFHVDSPYCYPGEMKKKRFFHLQRGEDQSVDTPKPQEFILKNPKHLLRYLSMLSGQSLEENALQRDAEGKVQAITLIGFEQAQRLVQALRIPAKCCKIHPSENGVTLAFEPPKNIFGRTKKVDVFAEAIRSRKGLALAYQHAQTYHPIALVPQRNQERP